jgi:Tyrosine phosphatase family
MRRPTRWCFTGLAVAPDALHRRSRATRRAPTVVGVWFAVVLFVVGCATVPPAPGPRPDDWASAIAAPGLPNLYRVDANLYRAAQPSPAGFELLATRPSLYAGDRPIQTVVSLRAFHDDVSPAPAPAGLQLEQIRFMTWHPENEDVIRFLRIATTPALQPVLVHCQHGSDRTGTMVAIYRIAYEPGWSKAKAVDEMVNGGYGFHPLWQNLVRYIDALDIDAIKAEVARQGPWR